VLLDGLTSWMSHRGFADLAAMRGLLSAARADGESARERGDYVSSLLEADLGHGAW